MLMHAELNELMLPTVQRVYFSQLKYPVPVTAPLNLNI